MACLLYVRCLCYFCSIIYYATAVHNLLHCSTALFGARPYTTSQRKRHHQSWLLPALPTLGYLPSSGHSPHRIHMSILQTRSQLQRLWVVQHPKGDQKHANTLTINRTNLCSLCGKYILLTRWPIPLPVRSRQPFTSEM